VILQGEGKELSRKLEKKKMEVGQNSPGSVTHRLSVRTTHTDTVEKQI
jgi:hypothetical protein